jgi:hypothetical protein
MWGSVVSSARMKSFPVKIPTLWRQAFPGLVIGELIGRVSLLVQGEPYALPNTLPLMGVAAVVVMMTYFFQPTLCGASGLKLMSAWGYRRSVTWPEITQVTFDRLYWIQPSLRLTDRRGRSHWIARDTKDLKGLHSLSTQHGGAAHPLTAALETPLFEL